jgi:transcriptional regulator with XRE-family HTH domain
MSVIGQNIKKIRSVKGYSQSDFAELFGMKRASIGSYEEGRAEPKIGTIIEIANHFGISIDDLLTKELSVNDLYRFDIFRKELSGHAVHNLNPSHMPTDLVPISYVDLSDQQAYLSGELQDGTLPYLRLPLKKGRHYTAFELADNAMMVHGSGPGSHDVVVAYQSEKFSLQDAEVGKAYLFQFETEIMYRQLHAKSLSGFVLAAANKNVYAKRYPGKDLRAIWRVCRIVTKNIGNPDDLLNRLSDLENDLRILKNNPA